MYLALQSLNKPKLTELTLSISGSECPMPIQYSVTVLYGNLHTKNSRIQLGVWPQYANVLDRQITSDAQPNQ